MDCRQNLLLFSSGAKHLHMEAPFFFALLIVSPFSFFDNCLVSLRLGGESDLLSPEIDSKASVA